METISQSQYIGKSLDRSGIYYIVSRTTGKYYIGSAISIRKRWSVHRSELKRNKHDNGRLQNAWNKYGENDFVFGVIEFTAANELLIREQYWLDITQVSDANVGYNIGPVAGTPMGCTRSESFKTAVSHSKSRIWMGFISPSGEIVTINNLRDFCKEHNLSPNNMRALYRGLSVSHKGWRHVSAPLLTGRQLKSYSGFIDPSGNQIDEITGLHQFCIKHDLDTSAMMRLMRGIEISHKGWTYKSVEADE